MDGWTENGQISWDQRDFLLDGRRSGHFSMGKICKTDSNYRYVVYMVLRGFYNEPVHAGLDADGRNLPGYDLSSHKFV